MCTHTHFSSEPNKAHILDTVSECIFSRKILRLFCNSNSFVNIFFYPYREKFKLLFLFFFNTLHILLQGDRRVSNTEVKRTLHITHALI